MSEFLAIKKQIADLEVKAERAKQQEVSEQVKKIIAIMQQYDIHLSDISKQLPASARRSGTTDARKVVSIRYRHPVTGQTWTGRGKPPVWLAEEEKKGNDRKKFLIA